MNKNLLAGFLLTIGSFALSQSYLKSDNVKVKTLNENGSVKFVSFQSNSNISTDESISLIKEIYNLKKFDFLKKLKTETDVFGSQHEVYKQEINGVGVEFNIINLHSKNGLITSINGNFSSINLLEPINSIKSESEILELGLGKLIGTFTWDEFQNSGNLEKLKPKGELVILPAKFTNGKGDRYAYHFPIVSTDPFFAEKIYFDAISGDVLYKDALLKDYVKTNQKTLTQEQSRFIENLKITNIQKQKFAQPFLLEGIAETKYSGTKNIETSLAEDETYILFDEENDIYTKDVQNTEYIVLALFGVIGGIDGIESFAVEFTDDDNNWTTEEHEENKDNAALDVHWGVKSVKNYFFDTYNRDSYDNQGGALRSYAHVGVDFVNAAWLSLSDGVGCMLYGDGDFNPETETGTYDALVSLDVTAHELAHAVTGSEGALVYEREPGALNEGFSDIWAAVIEGSVAPEKEKWLIGEEIVYTDPAGFRSMSNPNLFNQPDTYLGDLWVDATPEGCVTPDISNDYCGVHYNSGVLNYWFYLLSDGGTGNNDNDYAFDVTGIGIEKSADIIYDVMTNYIESQSNYNDVKTFTIQSAETLYGENSPEATEVVKAWCAVGVETGETCNFLSTNDQIKNDFLVFPNPVNDFLNIHSTSSSSFDFEIFNVAGQLLQSGTVSNKKINVSILPKGVYILSLFDGESKQNIKFIKK